MVVVNLKLWLISPIMLMKLMMNVNVIACDCVCDWDKGMVALGCYAQAPIPALDTRWNGQDWSLDMCTDPQGRDSAIQRAENPNEKGTHVVGILGPWKHVVIEVLHVTHRGDRDNWIMRIWWVLSREGDGRGKSQGPKRTTFLWYLMNF